MDYLKDVEASISQVHPAKNKLDLYRHATVQAILNPGVGAVAVYRLSNHLYNKNWKLASKFVDRFIEFAFGCQLCGESQIGPGLRIFHPAGLVVSPHTNIGKNATLMGGAAMGVRDLHSPAAYMSPTLGDNVTVAIGAKILGKIRIGDGATIAANAVVMQEIPDGGYIAVGIPAKLIHPKPKAAPEVEPAVRDEDAA